jgi:hypothetical protein
MTILSVARRCPGMTFVQMLSRFLLCPSVSRAERGSDSQVSHRRRLVGRGGGGGGLAAQNPWSVCGDVIRRTGECKLPVFCEIRRSHSVLMNIKVLWGVKACRLVNNSSSVYDGRFGITHVR